MSDKFYTNVQMYGNSILLRGYNNGERFTARENFYPTLFVSTKKDTVVDVQINNDKSEWLFDFNDLFETHDDMEVLRRMDMDLGLERGQVTGADLDKAKSMVPKALEPYIIKLAQHGKGSSNMPRVRFDF